MGTDFPVSVLSDHANLRYFMTAQLLTPRQARWASFLGEFNFEILHTPGKTNPADPASRRCDFVGNKEDSARVILLGSREIKEIGINAISIRNPGRFDISSFMPVDLELTKRIETAYQGDALITGVHPAFLHFVNGIWWWRDRIYLPMSLRSSVLKEVHESCTGGHWGAMKTFDLLSRSFGWPNMRKDVLSFLNTCGSCQQVKVDRRPPQGQLVPLPIPDRPWSTIGIDFIVKLPLSNEFDSVMVVVDHFSKAAHFIPAKESWGADELAKAFVDKVFRFHGLPDVIISDRGSTLVSAFWKSVMSLLGIKGAPSTAFHPQTDGQVERTNALLEDYLRHYVSEDQTNWADLLALAEFSYNNSASSSTGMTPFFALLGYHPRFNSWTGSSGRPAADEFVRRIQEIQELLQENLVQAKDAQARFYNKDRRVATTYNPGDLVWLSRRNLKTRRPNNKLDVRRLGPFRVVRMVGSNAAELKLPPDLQRLHPVFNVSLLMPFAGTLMQEDSRQRAHWRDLLIRDEQAIKTIVDYRVDATGVHEYLVKLDGCSDLDALWMPLSTIPLHLDTFLKRFHRLAPMRGVGPPQHVWISRAKRRVDMEAASVAARLV